MHIESLKIFADLVDTRSFSKTAKLNGVTQSAVSQQLRAMENYYKVLLVDRTSKRFRLSREGERLNEAVREILRCHERATGALQEMRDQISGAIRISTIYTIGFHELPPVVRRFLASYPAVDVRVEYRRSNMVVEDVLQSEVDLGLVAYPTRAKNIEIIPFAHDRLVVACNPRHPLAERREINLGDLAGQRFIGFDQDVPTRRAIDQILSDHNVDVSLVREFDNVETLKRAVEVGIGLALVPSSTIRQEVAQGALVGLEVKGAPFPPRPLAVIHRSGFVLTPAMRKFIESLRSSDFAAGDGAVAAGGDVPAGAAGGGGVAVAGSARSKRGKRSAA
ncbi:MAG: LysR family transcriptional regulator [Puniceicoccales bacterium]|jgi:DNA-binding transcriptional LysR family regulator|nr:LysR family transcriptional regulator [Puniceicoccales bacterium]